MTVAEAIERLHPSSRRAIVELVQAITDIEDALAPKSGGGGGRTGKPESRPPGDIDAARIHRVTIGRVFGIIDSVSTWRNTRGGCTAQKGPYKRRG